jgi:hypothetical protein
LYVYEEFLHDQQHQEYQYQLLDQGWPETANIGGLSRIFVMRVKFFSNRTQKNFRFRWKKTKIFDYWGVVTTPTTPGRATPVLDQNDQNDEVLD